LLTSVVQVVVWGLLTFCAGGGLRGVRKEEGPPEIPPEPPRWFPQQRWAAGLSLQEFYARWRKDQIFPACPDLSPRAFDLGPSWPARLKEKAPEWARRDLLLGEADGGADRATSFDGKANAQLEGPWGSLKGQLQVDLPGASEARDARHWQAEHSLQVPVAGPLYVFGEVSTDYNTATAQQQTFSSRTGIGCKLKPLPGSEIVLSGGSQTNYSEDPLQPKRLPVEKSQLVLQLQANYALLGPLKVEYQGAAMPALDPLDHSRLQQDFRFALPLGRAGDLRLGAKHQWEEQPGATRTSWSDGMQLYLGIGLKR
jgi:hypothetical protein